MFEFYCRFDAAILPDDHGEIKNGARRSLCLMAKGIRVIREKQGDKTLMTSKRDDKKAQTRPVRKKDRLSAVKMACVFQGISWPLAANITSTAAIKE